MRNLDFADVERILFANGGEKEGQIQHEIGRRRGMQCLLCNSPRILSEAIQIDGASEDVGNSREFSGVCWRGWMHTTSLTNTAEGGQLNSASDFIAHEHHESRCVPFCE
jgi:hypothetical protein